MKPFLVLAAFFAILILAAGIPAAFSMWRARRLIRAALMREGDRPIVDRPYPTDD